MNLYCAINYECSRKGLCIVSPNYTKALSHIFIIIIFLQKIVSKEEEVFVIVIENQTSCLSGKFRLGCR